MKKIVGLILAAVMTVIMAGCGDLDGSMFDTDIKSHLGISDGLSAYEIAVENGFVGTEEAWLESLRGDAGVQGVPGLEGLSAYQLWILAGNVGDEEAFIASLQGATGEPGTAGADGTDGVCNDDNCSCECPIITDPITPIIPVPDGVIAMQFKSKLTGLTGVKIGHLRDGVLISIEDANITDEGNGTYSVIAEVEVSESGNHNIGITFDN